MASTRSNGVARIGALAVPAAVERPRYARTLWGDAWRRFRRHRLAMAGAATFVLLTFGCIVGPFVYRVPINAIDFGHSMSPPSAAHPFGTNDLGQDMLARVLYGGRISIAVGFAAMLTSITLGVLVGAIAGFFGGHVDNLLMRLTDMFLSFPGLVLLLLIVYLFHDPITRHLGTQVGTFVLIVSVIGILNWMPTARLVRAGFLAVKEKEFVEAARSLGVGPIRQMARHILPNVLSPVIVAGTLSVAAAILLESTLSFLGYGFPPDVPTWGRLLFDAQNYLDLAPHMALFPGIMICLAILSINYVGDGLRDALDPTRVF